MKMRMILMNDDEYIITNYEDDDIDLLDENDQQPTNNDSEEYEIDFEHDEEDPIEFDEAAEDFSDVDIHNINNSRMAYRDALKLKKMTLEKKIENLDKKIEKARLFTKRAEKKRLKYKRQLVSTISEGIESAISNSNPYSNRVGIHRLDKIHDRQAKKEKELHDQIADLHRHRERLTEAGEKRRLNKKVIKKQRKLKKLQNREVRVTRMQRSIILARQFLQRKRKKLIRKDAKREYYQNKEDYYKSLNENLEYSNTLGGNIKKFVAGKVYDHKEKKFKRKKEKKEKTLESLKKKLRIKVEGANITTIPSRDLESMVEQEPINSNDEQIHHNR